MKQITSWSVDKKAKLESIEAEIMQLEDKLEDLYEEYRRLDGLTYSDVKEDIYHANGE